MAETPEIQIIDIEIGGGIPEIVISPGSSATIEIDPSHSGDDYSMDVAAYSENYNALINKPQINGVTLEGNKTSEELHIITESGMPYSKIKKIKNYFYEVYYDNIDYNFAFDHIEEMINGNIGGCTSIRKNNFYGRNYDWTYDDRVEFLVRTPRWNGRFSSMGISAGTNYLTDETAFDEDVEARNCYKIVPFRMMDGINEYGVIANINVVPLVGEMNQPTTPLIEKKLDLHICLVVRFILDHFKTAHKAVEYIQNFVSIHQSEAIARKGYEIHIMVADENNTCLLEVINNELIVTCMNENAESHLAGKPYMTNFHLSNINFVNDTIFTPADVPTHLPTQENNIDELGAGLERYKLIQNSYNGLENKEDMRALMNQLMYTRSYPSCTLPGGVANPFWYTEFVGVENLTVDSAAADYDEYMDAFDYTYTHRQRKDAEYDSWQTIHSSVYDFKNRTLNIIVQEDLEELEYKLDILATKNYVDKKLEEKQDKNIATIIITPQMIISQNPLIIQLNEEQNALIVDEKNVFITFDASSLGMEYIGGSIFTKSKSNIANEYVFTNNIIEYETRSHEAQRSTTNSIVYNSVSKQGYYKVLTLTTQEELEEKKDKNYIHRQTEASNSWVIIHNLNKYPSVTVIDSAGNEIIGEVIYDSLNQITINFNEKDGEFKGIASLN